MAETVFWEAPNGDLLAIVRVDQRVFPPIPGTEIPQESIDHAMRMVVFRSQDGGRRWKLDRPLGSFYGEMYPNVLRLASGKLLLTFTVRRFRPHPPLYDEHGRRCLAQAANDAVLSIKSYPDRASGGLTASYEGPCMHEVLFDDLFLAETEVTTLDFAKAMIDEGFHPATVYFPLVVQGALLTEPTESESKDSLDRLIGAMRFLAQRAREAAPHARATDDAHVQRRDART